MSADIIAKLEARDLLEEASAVARAHHVTLEQLCSRARRRSCVMARRALVERIRLITTMSLEEIAELLGFERTTLLKHRRAPLATSFVERYAQVRVI